MSKPITDVLRELRGGLVVLKASEELSQVIKACAYSGKSGEMTIKLKIEPAGADNKEMHVTAKVSSKRPADPGLEDRSIFFNNNGDLVRDLPQQKNLLSGVEAGNADGGSPADARRFG